MVSEPPAPQGGAPGEYGLGALFHRRARFRADGQAPEDERLHKPSVQRDREGLYGDVFGENAAQDGPDDGSFAVLLPHFRRDLPQVRPPDGAQVYGHHREQPEPQGRIPRRSARHLAVYVPHRPQLRAQDRFLRGRTPGPLPFGRCRRPLPEGRLPHLRRLVAGNIGL